MNYDTYKLSSDIDISNEKECDVCGGRFELETLTDVSYLDVTGMTEIEALEVPKSKAIDKLLCESCLKELKKKEDKDEVIFL